MLSLSPSADLLRRTRGRDSCDLEELVLLLRVGVGGAFDVAACGC